VKIKILSLFPEIFDGFLSTSLIKKAQERGLFQISFLNPRDFSDPPHFHVDDTPYGGGAGMVMKPEPLVKAIQEAKKDCSSAKVILLHAAGRPFNQTQAKRLSKEQELILVCGRYEGVDQRAIDIAVDEEISIGDYVLMGGEVPAMVVLESSIRLLEGALGNKASLDEESFTKDSDGQLLLEAPQYTKPADFMGHKVPDVLLSGNHQLIASWRKEHSFKITKEKRPDLLKD